MYSLSKLVPIENANLPTSKARLVISSCGKTAKKALTDKGVKVISPATEPMLDSGLANHSDISFLHLGKKNFMASGFQMDLIDNLTDFGLKYIYLTYLINSPYPEDVPLNAAIIGKTMICNPKIVLQELMDYAKRHKFTIIPVKQGYSKCSVCVVNHHALITEDLGIEEECKERGLDVLLIRKGSIKLQGYDYGFLGGSTGLIAQDTLAVNGDLNLHSDAKAIKNFLEKHKVKYLSLSNEPICDVGGILPIMQDKV